MNPNAVVSIQIEFAEELELAANILSLVSPTYDTDTDADGEYEYVFGLLDNEIIEINRRIGGKMAGVFTYNDPCHFSARSYKHVIEAFNDAGIPILSHQSTEDLQDDGQEAQAA